jgi:hypothetical protein
MVLAKRITQLPITVQIIINSGIAAGDGKEDVGLRVTFIEAVLVLPPVIHEIQSPH